MFELLEKIRQKPERTKRRIAFLFSFFFVGLIFVVWLSVIYPDLNGNKIKEEKVTSKEPSPISTMADMFSSVFLSVDEQISEVKDLFSSFSDNSSYYVSSSTDPIASSTEAFSTSTEPQKSFEF